MRIITKNGQECIGVPINVDYAEDNPSGEDELVIENDTLHGFAESEIESIEIVE